MACYIQRNALSNAQQIVTAVSACSLWMMSVHLQHLRIIQVMHSMQLNGKIFHDGLQEEWLAISVCPPTRSMTVQCKFFLFHS